MIMIKLISFRIPFSNRDLMGNAPVASDVNDDDMKDIDFEDEDAVWTIRY